MRTALTWIVDFVCCASVAAQSLGIAEENIIGTWHWMTLPGKHGMLRFEFRRDHTFGLKRKASRSARIPA
jgi:hypothetical protein